jgi:hypothetical protein
MKLMDSIVRHENGIVALKFNLCMFHIGDKV